MPRVFISNTKVQETEEADFTISPSKGIEQLYEKAIDFTGNTAYVIDVHCTFKGAEKMQQQGGVAIYRHLLKEFDGKQDKLKVVFYSPIPKEDLVKLKPENYVLTLLPFVECKYEGKEEFGAALQKAENEVCPQFNSASENLLSGWVLANEKRIKKGEQPEKINTNGKKILFIDDQQSEWKSVYNVVFENTAILFIKNSKGNEIQSQTAYRQKLKSDWNEFVKLVISQIEADKPDLILSDLYIEENHEETKFFKTENDLDTISGFKLIKAVVPKFPWIPYIMFTSSNKVWNFELFKNYGAWKWAVKNTATTTNSDDIKNQFLYFKDCILNCLDKQWCDINKLWKDWHTLKINGSIADTDTIEIVDDCFIKLRKSFVDGKIGFSTIYKYYLNSVYATVVINVGGIFEKMSMHFRGNIPNYFGKQVFSTRNYFAHNTNYKEAVITDAVISIGCLIHILTPGNNLLTTPLIPSFNLLHTRGDNLFYYAQLKKAIEDSKITICQVTKNYIDKAAADLKESVYPDLLNSLKKKNNEITKTIKSVNSEADFLKVIIDNA